VTSVIVVLAVSVGISLRLITDVPVGCL